MRKPIVEREVAAGAGDAVAGPRPMQWALLCLSLSMLMPSLDTSIVNVGLPSLVQAFSCSFQAVQWVVLAYLLAIATLIVGAGRLGDVIGGRRLLLWGIGLFTAASLLCGCASTLWLLIAARALAGLGAAVMLALTVAMVGATIPKAETGRAMGLLGTMSAVGTTLGPSLGGLLVGGLGWRAIFFVNVPLGILNLLLAQRSLPADRPRPQADLAAFDIVGTLLFSFTLAAYALAMTIGRGRFGPLNVALLSVAAAGAGVFVFAEARARSPLIRLRMFRDSVIGPSLATSALVATVMMATLVIGPFYLARGLGLRATFVGLVMSAGPLVAALSGVPAGRIVDRFGASRIALAGLTAMAVGCAALSRLSPALGIPGYVLAIVVLTVGYALFAAANNTVIMADAGPGERGVVSAMLSLSRYIGLISGASVMGAVFAAASAEGDCNAAHGASVTAGLRTTFSFAVILLIAALAIAFWSRTVAGRAGRLGLRLDEERHPDADCENRE